MYHSHLLINTGDNPDRPEWSITRRWLRNLYRVHQRLCMAFPTNSMRAGSRLAAYCSPYDPRDYTLSSDVSSDVEGDSPATRGNHNRFLFRIDYPIDKAWGGRRPVIIVQSSKEPDWDHAFGLSGGEVNDAGHPIGNAGFLLAISPQKRKVRIELTDGGLVLEGERETHRFRSGDLVRFRIRANPTRKIKNGAPNGKRVRIDPTIEAHTAWLSQKLGDATQGDVQIVNFLPGWAYGWRTKYEPDPSQRMRWWSVLLEGTFRLGNPTTLQTLLISGIGPAKAFGFGLLSVAPVQGK